jgi:hypothetical protein
MLIRVIIVDAPARALLLAIERDPEVMRRPRAIGEDAPGIARQGDNLPPDKTNWARIDAMGERLRILVGTRCGHDLLIGLGPSGRRNYVLPQQRAGMGRAPDASAADKFPQHEHRRRDPRRRCRCRSNKRQTLTGRSANEARYTKPPLAQAGQILFALEALDRRKPQGGRRFRMGTGPLTPTSMTACGTSSAGDTM